jgi:hypothetical protein
VHHARPWPKEQSAWEAEVLNWHIAPNLVYLVSLVYFVCLVEPDEPDEPNKPDKPNRPDRPEYSGIELPSATGILDGLLPCIAIPRGFEAEKQML